MKGCLAILVLLLSVQLACGQQKTVKKKRPKARVTHAVKPQATPPATQGIVCADSLVAFAKQQLGTPYKYACYDPGQGFDCSGFVYYVFGHFHIKVPRSSIDYAALKPEIPADSARVGDVIVFTGTNAAIRHAGHVAIVISGPGEELTFIHSSSNTKRGGVIISTYTSSPYYAKRFLKIVRVPAEISGACP